jgi:hypothetical protein
MKRILFVASLVMLAAPLVAAAQNKPDYTGTWLVDKQRSEAQGTAGVPDEELVIRQTPAELKVDRRIRDRVWPLLYKLDGSVSVNKTEIGTTTSTTTWVGVVLLTKSQLSGRTDIELSQARTLSADGKVMTVEVSVRRAGRTESTRTLVYNRR